MLGSSSQVTVYLLWIFLKSNLILEEWEQINETPPENKSRVSIY